MIQVTNRQLDIIWKISGSPISQQIMKKMGTQKSYRYSEIKKFTVSSNNDKMAGGLTHYYTTKMLKANILKKDKSTGEYYLSRIGVRMLEVIKTFEEIIAEYDLSDVKADGKLKI